MQATRTEEERLGQYTENCEDCLQPFSSSPCSILLEAVPTWNSLALFHSLPAHCLYELLSLCVCACVCVCVCVCVCADTCLPHICAQMPDPPLYVIGAVFLLIRTAVCKQPPLLTSFVLKCSRLTNQEEKHEARSRFVVGGGSGGRFK